MIPKCFQVYIGTYLNVLPVDIGRKDSTSLLIVKYHTRTRQDDGSTPKDPARLQGHFVNVIYLVWSDLCDYSSSTPDVAPVIDTRRKTNFPSLHRTKSDEKYEVHFDGHIVYKSTLSFRSDWYGTFEQITTHSEPGYHKCRKHFD